MILAIRRSDPTKRDAAPPKRWTSRLTPGRLLLLLVAGLLLWKAVWLLGMQPRRKALQQLELCGCHTTDTYGDYVHPEKQDWELTFFFLQRRGVPGSLRYLLPVDGLNCSRAQLTDEALKGLRHFPELTELYLDDSDVTDEKLKHVSTLTDLQVLWLYDTRITDAGLRHLSDLDQLRVLYVGMTGISGEGLKHLSCDDTLAELMLFEIQLGDAGLLQLRRFKNLRWLDLTSIDLLKPIHDDSYRVLAELRQLKTIRTPNTFQGGPWEPYIRHVPEINFSSN